MAQKDEIIKALYAVIDETNRELPAKQQPGGLGVDGPEIASLIIRYDCSDKRRCR